MTRDRGQATVELALLLPFVVLTLGLLLQVVSLSRDRIALVHAAGVGIRTAVVEPDIGAVRRDVLASSSLDAARLTIEVQGDVAPGGMVRVRVRYVAPLSFPLLSKVMDDPEFEETFSAIVE